MEASVLSVGINSATESFIESNGLKVIRASHVRREELGAVARDCSAALFGPTSRCGATTIQSLREHDVSEPIVCVLRGPRSETWSRQCARLLRSGADDVLVGPSSREEVKASLMACLRRVPPPRLIHEFRVDGRTLRVDPAGTRAWLDGRLIPLTQLEFDVISLLAEKKGVLTRQHINNELYYRHGGEFPEHRDPDAIYVAVSRLRKGFGEVNFIKTVFGEGFVLLGRVQ